MDDGRPGHPSGQDKVLLQLGPDAAQKITCWVGSPTCSFMAALYAFLAPDVAGLIVIPWAFALWYCLRSGFVPLVSVRQSSLNVRTPLRTFYSPWLCVLGLGFGGHIVVRLSDGRHFRLPQYTATFITGALASPTALFSTRGRLEQALKEAWQPVLSRQPPMDKASEITWTYPSILVVSATILAAVGVEIGTVMLR